MPFGADESTSNPSSNPTFPEMLEARLSHRQVLAGGVATTVLGLLAPPLSGGGRDAFAQGGLLRFASVPVSTADALVAPSGYVAQVLYAWGDPISARSVFKPDASNSAEDQAAQAGMHHDGMHSSRSPSGATTRPTGSSP
jgi:secreted PhoX family phosphatase